MQTFDHIKPYLPSTKVHWSYPALSDNVVRWQQQVGRLPPAVMTAALTAERFSALVIDRNGYVDHGAELLSELGIGEASAAVIARSDRYIGLDLSAVRKATVAEGRLPRVGGRATPASAGLPACGESAVFNLEWIGDASVPFSRQPVIVSSAGEFVVSGWAVDDPARRVAADVDVVVGDAAYPAFYGLDRPDVANYFGVPEYTASGFVVRLTGRDVGYEPSPLSLRIVSADRTCYYQSTAIQVVGR
jgi:hypothetical protein